MNTDHNEVLSPPIEELRERFKDVMQCPAITNMTRWTPTNSAPAPNEEELLRRSRDFAPGMKALSDLVFKEA